MPLRRVWPPCESFFLDWRAPYYYCFYCYDFALTTVPSRSWVTFFFRSRYDIDEGKLGSVFFTTSIIAACSMLVASSLAKRFGNVNVSGKTTCS